MPYAVLAHRGDTDAELVALALASRTSAGVALVWADELLLDSSFSHRIEDGAVHTRVRLADGRQLASEELLGLVCRLAHALPPQFASAAPADRDYATMEAQALLLSWLVGLECPLLNPPSPRSLSGPALGLPEWLLRGAEAGLRGRGLRLTPVGDPPPGRKWLAVAADLSVSSTVALEPGAASAGELPCLWLEPLAAPPRQLLVIGERVIGDVGAEAATACVELARRTSSPVLAVHLAPSGAGGEVFCGVSTMPALGPSGAEAVAELLIGAAG